MQKTRRLKSLRSWLIARFIGRDECDLTLGRKYHAAYPFVILRDSSSSYVFRSSQPVIPIQQESLAGEVGAAGCYVIFSKGDSPKTSLKVL